MLKGRCLTTAAFFIKYLMMKIFQKVKNLCSIFYLKKNEAVFTCLQNDIELTDVNISEVKTILKQKLQTKINL